MYLKETKEQIDSRSSTSSRDWRYCTVPLAWLVCLDWGRDCSRRKNGQDGWTMTCACPPFECSLTQVSVLCRSLILRGGYYVSSMQDFLSWLTRARSKYIRPHVSNGSSVHVVNGHWARHLKVGSLLFNHPYPRVLITYIWVDAWWWLWYTTSPKLKVPSPLPPLLFPSSSHVTQTQSRRHRTKWRYTESRETSSWSGLSYLPSFILHDIGAIHMQEAIHNFVHEMLHNHPAAQRIDALWRVRFLFTSWNVQLKYMVGNWI